MKTKHNDYDAFVEKFKPKLTTDDCFTPPAFTMLYSIMRWRSSLTGGEKPSYARSILEATIRITHIQEIVWLSIIRRSPYMPRSYAGISHMTFRFSSLVRHSL